MITVSDKMKEYVLRTGRRFNGKIEVGEETLYEGIMSVFIDRSMCSDCLNFGEVNSAYCTISVFDPTVNFAGKEVAVYISAVIDGMEEWGELGVFTAEKPTISDRTVDFSAFDCIKYKTDVTYFPTLEGESAVSDVFKDICCQCGIPFKIIESELTVNPAKLSGRKCKEALGQIAGFLGGNIVTDNEGRVTVRYFSECDYTVSEDMMSEPTIGEAVFSLDGISCTVGDDILTCGSTEGNVLAFSNVLMTQEQLNSIFERHKSLIYRSVSVENLRGNPFLEVGDVISLERHGITYKIPIMHLTVDFDGGVMNDIETYHKTTEEESGAKSVSDVIKEIEQIKTENKLSSEFSDAISNALGIYYSKQTLEDGSYKIYGHDKENLADSTYIFTNTSEGFAFVTGDNCWNNGNPIWQYGVSKDGNAILKMLNVYKLSADLIEAGILKSIDGSTYFDLTNAVQKSTKEETDDEGNVWKCETTISNGEIEIKKFKNGTQMDVLQLSMNNYAGAQISGIKIIRKDVSEFEEPEDWESTSEAMKYLLKLLYYNGTASFKVLSSDTSKNTAAFLLDDKLVFPCLDNKLYESYFGLTGARTYGPMAAAGSLKIFDLSDEATEIEIFFDSVSNYLKFLNAAGYYFDKNIILPQSIGISGTDADGNVYETFKPLNANGHAVMGYDLYAQKKGNSHVYGNDVVLFSATAGNASVRPYYRKGDSVSLTFNGAGFVTTGSSAIFFSVPLDKPVIGSPTVTASSVGGLILRQNNKYTHGSNSGAAVSPSSYSAAIEEGYIRVVASMSETTNATNNDSIGINWSGKITFS
ncbi:MAG: hypothetical protein IJ491_03660 [Clostridia bacterium]|nr:hypothetical protein [Clostridia bacterium]